MGTEGSIVSIWNRTETFAHGYLEVNPGDLVGLAQILGHESLDTTARYTKRSQDQLGDAAERLDY